MGRHPRRGDAGAHPDVFRHERGDDHDGPDCQDRTRTTRPGDRRRRAGVSLQAVVPSMSSPTEKTPQTPSQAPSAPVSGDAHLFDRLSVLYKYRWAAIAVFVMVVSWVMVDSYTRIPAYRAMARVLVEDPNADIATPSEIQRSVTAGDP